MYFISSLFKTRGFLKEGIRYADADIYIRVRYLPKGIYPRAISHATISQVAPSQMCNFTSDNFP